MKSSRIIIIYSFSVCLFMMTIGIFSAKNSAQLLNSFIYLPLIFYFGTRLLQFRRKTTSKITTPPQIITNKTSVTINQITVNQQPTESNNIAPIEPEVVKDVPDNDKRLFLKLIGSAGFSMLLMALFTKKAQASFFGSAPIGPGIVSIKDIAGNRINPSEKQPTDGYGISNMDTGGLIEYYGFVKKTGEWYIMKKNVGTFGYTKGSGSYSTNWDIRDTLIYDYFNNVFG